MGSTEVDRLGSSRQECSDAEILSTSTLGSDSTLISESQNSI